MLLEEWKKRARLDVSHHVLCSHACLVRICNSIGDSGLAAICGMLEKNSTIELIDLHSAFRVCQEMARHVSRKSVLVRECHR